MTNAIPRPTGMLSIKRLPRESVILELPDGRHIVVRMIGKNRLGINAPSDVIIIRDEHLLQGEELAAFRGKGKTNA
jgi:sRNA-binding carbon storage regulator CsrA